MFRTSTPAMSPDTEAKLRRLLADPRRRSGVVTLLNNEGRKMREIAEQISEDELHRRPDDRRTPESLAHGKEYHDSWRVVPAKEQGYDKITVKIGNDHPAARIIENGAKPHTIQAPSDDPRDALVFPFIGPVGRGGPGRKGGFAVPWGSAPEFFGTEVNHPGVGAHRIGRRARDTYRKRSKRILNR